MEHKQIYCFLSDANNQFYKATQLPDGSYTVSIHSNPIPLKSNPFNLKEVTVEIGTNKVYNSLNVGVIDPLKFTDDGYAILSSRDAYGKGIKEVCYLTIIEWDGVSLYRLAYSGKIDFANKNNSLKDAVYTAPTIDDSSWGVLSQRDSVVAGIQCNATNPKAVKVVVDGITLVNKITFQSVNASFSHNNTKTGNFFPIVIVNQDGDSSDLIVKGVSADSYYNIFADLNTSTGWFLQTYKDITGVQISGSISVFFTDSVSPSNIKIEFHTNFSQSAVLIFEGALAGTTINNGVDYNVDFDFTWNLQEGEKIFFLASSSNNGIDMVVTSRIKNIEVRTKTTPSTQVVYGIRAIDFVKQLVSKVTDGRFSIGSEFLTVNDTDIVLCGDALRGIKNATIFSNFQDFFKTFDVLNYMALRSILGQLFIEKATTVYNPAVGQIVDFGEASNVDISNSLEYMVNEIVVGSKNQDLRHPSGRLEFNSENRFSTPLTNVDNKLELVTPYRLGCFDAQFVIVDYLGSSTKDNSGDKSVYCLKIENTKIAATKQIENFELVTIDNVLLAPIIKTPYENDYLDSQRPFLVGIATPNTTVSIYCDKKLDGTATSDSNGNWTYSIANSLSTYTVGIYSGIHIIEAVYGTLQDPAYSVSVTINIATPVTESIVYPVADDEIADALPFINGRAPAGSPVNVNVDGSFAYSGFADQSGRWGFFSIVILGSGAHTVTLNANPDINFSVKADIECPIITYIGSVLDNHVVINNLPLIRGIAKPGENVRLYLNYINHILNQSAITANGDGYWEYQVIPATYTDPVTGTPVVLAPIRNGQSVISTDLVIKNAYINVSGYKLDRPDFAPITGVTDGTVFNTAYSPKRMMMAHYPLFSAMLGNIQNDYIRFSSGTKNFVFSTALPGENAIIENSDILISSLGSPIALMQYATVTVKTNQSFVQLLKNFNNGGVLLVTFKGNQLPLLPIGKLSMNNLFSSEKTIQCLIAPSVTYLDLLNFYKIGLKIEIMNGVVYHSDYNSLHAVQYDFKKEDKYNQVGLYQNWFDERNSFWTNNPEYIQKYSKSDIIRDQIIYNGLIDVFLDMYRCSDAELVDSFVYVQLSPNPVAVGGAYEVEINLSNYDEDQYFFVIRGQSQTNLSIDVIQVNDYSIITTCSGALLVGDIINIFYSINGASRQFSTKIKEEWLSEPISYAVTDLANQLNNSGYFSSVTLSSVSGTELDTIAVVSNPLFIVSFSYSSYNFKNSAIIERIDLRENWFNTILVEAHNTTNLTGAFFSSGFKTIIRVEGIVQKLDFEIQLDSFKDDMSNSDLLYSTVDKKRVIRYGNAKGIPDYLAMKINMAMSLDMFSTEGVFYTPVEAIKKSENVNGHPMNYYNANVLVKNTVRGGVFPAAESFDTTLLPIAVDPTAFGLPAGSPLNINVE